MNVYDFDKTIFDKDSSCEFVLFCLKKYPFSFLKHLPGVVLTGVKKLLHRADTKQLKEKIFAFLRDLPDVEKTVLNFWAENTGGIGQWYLTQKCDSDIIISASPEFLLKPIGEYLGTVLLATPMDASSGKITGLNCHDEEKVRRFYEAFPDGRVDSFYSDSLSDSPMAEIADRAFMVNHGRLSPWPKK